MTKHTFLNTLERRLSALPKAEREEYILYYEELINDRMEEGCSEQEAVAQLEEIDLIVGRILGERSDLSAGSTPPPAVPKSRGCLKAFLIGCAALVLLALILSFAGVAAIGIVFDRLEGRNTPMGGELRLEEEKTASSVDSGETVVGAQPESSLSLPTEIPSGVEHLLGEVSADRLRSIDIDWTADAVHIEPYDGETVRVAEWSDEVLDESHHGRMTMEGAEMEIDFSIRENVRGIPSKRLIVQLPREFYLDSLSVDSASAEVMVTGVTGREVEIDTASGNVTLDGFEIVEIDTASGSVWLGDRWERADLETASGQLRVTMMEGTGYTLQFETASGRFYSGGQDRTQKKLTHIEGDGSRRIEVSTASGDLHIEKLTTE